MKNILLLLLLVFATNLASSQQMDQLKYLALGDSYTIGEAVPEKDRWPVQLVKRLREKGVDIADPEIIATTGWTTDELQQAINKANPSDDYDLVSLLIGVNNQYRGYPIEQYKKEFENLLYDAISFAGDNRNRVFVISIPDYGVTPFAKDKGLNPEKIAKELDEYNQIAKEITESEEVTFFEITKWSRKAAKNSDLVATDGLHPSGEMYENWVDTCFKWVHSTLATK